MANHPKPAALSQFEDCFERFHPDSRILDVGCGIGDLSAQMSRLVPDGLVLGVDNCYPDVVLAGRRFPRDQYPNLRFLPSDARTLRLHQEPFHFVVSRSCLHFLEVPGQSFPAMARHLVPGGTLHVWFLGEGHAARINGTLNRLKAEPEWRECFQGFRPAGAFLSPKDCLPWLARAQLLSTRCQLIRKTIDFPCKEMFTYWLQWGWRSHWDRLPRPRWSEFTDQFFNLYTTTQDGRYEAEQVWLVIDAVKLAGGPGF